MVISCWLEDVKNTIQNRSKIKNKNLHLKVLILDILLLLFLKSFGKEIALFPLRRCCQVVYHDEAKRAMLFNN